MQFACVCCRPRMTRATAAVDDNRWDISHSYSPMEYTFMVHEREKFVKREFLIPYATFATESVTLSALNVIRGRGTLKLTFR